MLTFTPSFILLVDVVSITTLDTRGVAVAFITSLLWAGCRNRNNS